MVTRIAPHAYVPSMTGTLVDMRLMERMVQEHLPSLHAHLEVLCCPLSLVTSEWLMSLFTLQFAPFAVHRILDWLFLESTPDVPVKAPFHTCTATTL